MTRGETEYAIRRALNMFDDWNDVTGFVLKFSSYYYEIQGLYYRRCSLRGASCAWN